MLRDHINKRIHCAMISSADIRRLAYETGFDLCGVAPPDIIVPAAERYMQWLREGYHAGMNWMAASRQRRVDPVQLMSDVRAVIMLGLNYFQPDGVELPPRHGRVSRYARGRDYHKVVGGMVKALLRRIEEAVNREAVIHSQPSDRFKWWVDYGPFLERAYAEHAGLGFIGKNSMLINRTFGSWIFLAEIVTSLPLEFDTAAPGEHGRCGRCRVCIDACPTGAILEGGMIDSRRCISYLTIEHKGEIPSDLAAAMGDLIFGCDICQAVCPLNFKRSHPTTRRGLLPERGVGEFVDCTAVLGLETREEFLALTAGTALTRPKLVGLKRNARIVLENRRGSTR